MPDREELTDAEIADLFHRMRNEETGRQSVREIAEQVICDLAMVTYDHDKQTHREVLQARALAIIRMQKEYIADDARIAGRKAVRRKIVQSIVSKTWDKFITLLTSVAVALGIGWLASKFGIKLPGGP